MAELAPDVPAVPRYTSEEYFALSAEGLLAPDDRVELLEGVIVSMPPSSPAHAATVSRVLRVLSHLTGDALMVRCQMPLVAGTHNVPEPDVALVAAQPDDCATAHPTTALLVVEVSESSLPADRLTKAPIYAAAGVREYWIVNLRDRCVEVHRQPAAGEARYAQRTAVRPGEHIEPIVLPGARIAVDDLLPAP